MFVALVILHAKSMRRFMFFCVASPVLPRFFSLYLINDMIFGKIVIEYKIRVLITAFV